MAEKKGASRAQKAVTDAKKKSGTAGAKGSPAPTPKKNKQKAGESILSAIPQRYLFAAAALLLFVALLILAVKPEGALLKVIHSMILGLIGKVGFFFSIPAMLYLFVILAFSGKEPVRMRSICLLVFVFLCGCIFHLVVNNQTFVGGLVIFSDLWTGGAAGTSGGVLCGTAAMLLRWACGSVFSAILLVVGAVFTLLAAFKITVPSIIRAIQNRPRDDWEETEEKPEPAALVVNHIANKRIEQKRQKRQQLAEELEEEGDILILNEAAAYPAKEKKSAPAAPAAPVSRPVERGRQDIFDEISDPVPASPEVLEAKPKPAVKTVPVKVEADEEELIPSSMPVYQPEIPIAPGPKVKPQVPPAKEKVSAQDAAVSAVEVAMEIAEVQAVKPPEYCYPPIDLLNPPMRSTADGTAEMRENSRRLNETLESFRIDAHIINVTRGPSVTRYEVELDKGVRLNKLTTVADDIALSLGAPSVRIAPVPGKISVVGIEVPNRAVTTVSLREVLSSQEFSKAKSKSSFAVGKDIGGSCIVGNIAKMPHMLIAGTTGSGKSVCMNSIILSLLYKSSPEDVKLIMVDPKMVELASYNGIPHLMIPVVTDPKKAAGSLQWAVTEMMRRYKTMSDAGVRDLESYNSIAMAEEDGQKLPSLIIIIDELADLMLVAAKEVEDSICRIAQMGRAAGIHLIIATQRPSADVITGLMKANIPSRIAFSVASAMESRIILDTQGAEKLVGKGDMLFAPIGCGKPLRVQGCFVADGEVEAVTSYVKNNYNANYDQQVLEEIEKKAQQTGKKAAGADPEPSAEELEGDEMLPAAVDVILETGQASVSMLQRRLKLGYARAARIVDEMEEKGIVGPFQGSKPRTILVTKEQWEAMKGGSAQMDFDDLPFDEGVPEEI